MDPQATTDTNDEAAERAAFDEAFNAEDHTDRPYKDGADDEATNVPSDEGAAPSPAPAAAPAPAAPAAPSPAPAPADAAVDPFASLPDEVKKVLSLVPEMSHQLKTSNGRIAALQREVSELRARPASPTPAPTQAPAVAEPDELPEVRAVRDQGLPEVADAIKAAVRAQMRPPAPPATAPAASAPTPAAPAPAHDPLAEEAAALAELHSDWADTMNSPDFKLWLNSQGEGYRDRVMTTQSGTVVAAALTKFKGRQAELSQGAQRAMETVNKRAARAAGAVSHRSGVAPGAGRGAVDEEQAAFEAAFKDDR